MSKFFATGDSSDESASDYSSDSSVAKEPAIQGNRFVYSSSESEDDAKRTVRTERDKRFETLKNSAQLIRNHLKINDWVALQRDVDQLQRDLDKSKSVLSKQTNIADALAQQQTQQAASGAASATAQAAVTAAADGVLPLFVVATIHQLSEQHAAEMKDKDNKKKMNALQARALNTMKQKVKKFMAQSQSQFDAYAANPISMNEAQASDDEAVAEKSSAKPAVKKTAAAMAAARKRAKSDSDSSDSSDDSSEESESSSDSEDDKRTKFTKKAVAAKKKPAVKSAKSESESSDESSSSGSESDDESDESDDKKKRTVKKKVTIAKKVSAKSDSDESSDDDSSDSDLSSDDSSSSSSGDEAVNLLSGPAAMYTREYWVKREESSSEESSSDEEERAEKRAKARDLKKAKLERQEAASVQKALQAAGKAAKDQSKTAVEQLKPEQVIARLKELLARRGKRGTDRLAMITELQLLSEQATEAAARLKIHTTLTSALFDVTLNKGTHMPTALWKQCLQQVNLIIDDLTANPNVRLTEDEHHVESLTDESLVAAAATANGQTEEAVAEAQHKASKEKRKAVSAAEQSEDLSATKAGGIQYVLGNLFSFVQLLGMEFRKSLQVIDYHSEEYVSRLRDEKLLEQLLTRTIDYYATSDKVPLQAQVTLLRLELIYYKYDRKADKIVVELNRAQLKRQEKGLPLLPTSSDAAAAVPTSVQPIGRSTHAELVRELATFLYAHGDDASRVRALLLHVYHLALHNHLYVARDMLLMSHISESVHAADIRTRVLFNRAMAALGLAAFRLAEYDICLEHLADLVQSNKIRELLAQGTSSQRWQERDVAKEEAEKKRQYPFHMHLSQDCIEASHLISAMLFEVPNIAAAQYAGARKLIISKAFRRQYEHTQRQAFTGPPEVTRDLVLCAARALQQGQVDQACSLLQRLKLWRSLQPDCAALIQQQLDEKLRQVALQTYLLTYSSYHASISLDQLCDKFKLTRDEACKVCSKLILDEQVFGAWNMSSDAILVQQGDSNNRLQRSALLFADKLNVLVEQNERIIDSKGGQQHYTQRADRQAGGGQGDWQGGNNRGEGGQRGGRGGGRGGARGGRGRGGPRY